MKIDKNEYLSHIQDDRSRNQLRRVLDFVVKTLKDHTLTYTDFLEPDLLEEAKIIIEDFDQLSYSIEGGFDNAERNIIAIYPWYYDYDGLADSPLRAIKITQHVEDIKHSQVLGSILGLGLVREKIGDIGFFDDKILVCILKEVEDYILDNLRQIHHYYVDVSQFSVEDLGSIEENLTERSLIVPSKRLDAVVSELYNISRSKTKALIEDKRAKLNYKVEIKSHTELQEEDLVSIRGFGRFKIKSFDGKTRKDKLRLTILVAE